MSDGDRSVVEEHKSATDKSQSDLTGENKSAIFNRVNLRPFEMHSNNVSANVSRKGSILLDATPIDRSFINSDKDPEE
jgi:hypothetical protein